MIQFVMIMENHNYQIIEYDNGNQNFDESESESIRLF